MSDPWWNPSAACQFNQAQRRSEIETRLAAINQDLLACDGQPTTAYSRWLRDERTKCLDNLKALGLEEKPHA